jgi:predicted transcriptional regulator YheO
MEIFTEKESSTLEFKQELPKNNQIVKTIIGFANQFGGRLRNGGRPKSLNSEKMALAIKLYDEKKHSIGQICRMMEISKPTLYKYIKAD